ncbi:amidohydrolase family protein [Kineosporia succinea]|uniref:amidohydrolase family protein n=1 Tax=Kineosporia succinea TaxID=84632 RepID=UPI003520E57A
MIRLTGPLLTGPDEVRDGAWVIGGRITFERPTGPGLDQTLVDGWVLPGLVDAHSHVGLDGQGAVDAATSEQQALADRDAGALLLRDAGSPADTRWIDDRDDLPVVVRAGRHIARTRRYLRHYAHEIEPEQLPATMAAQARLGDGWVKIVGDWIDRSTGDLAPCWPLDALRAGMAAAHAEGARVTAHCFGEECLPDLLTAGIDCVEHATGLDDHTRTRAASAGVPIVPTLINIATFPEIAERAREKFPRYRTHMLDLHRRRYERVSAAYHEGVPVFCGTDAGGSLPHGLVASEVAELHAAGLPRVAALDAACWSARRWLGRPALAEGAPADLVVYEADPRTDLRVVSTPQVVVLRGALTSGRMVG